MTEMLVELYATIVERRTSPRPAAYAASLFAAGEDEIIKKVGEEAIEVILAAKAQGDQRVVEEAADLLYHLLVLLALRGITLAQVEAELEARHRR